MSTVTRPPGGRLAIEADTLAQTAIGPTLLNKPTELIRLLWEASITRSGGFFLYYFDGATASGLPDRIFNDKGEAPLTMIVTYVKPSKPEVENQVTNYINAAVMAMQWTSATPPSSRRAPGFPMRSRHARTTVSVASRRAISPGIAGVAAAAAPLQLAVKAAPKVKNGVYFISPLATSAERDPAASRAASV